MNSKNISRAKRASRRSQIIASAVRSPIEQLEDRVMLSYTFSYNSGTQTATATGTAAVDSLVLEPVSGFIEYSVNGSAFSGNWGGSSVPAMPSVTVNTSLSSGDGSSFQLGTSTGPASQLLASFNVSEPGNTADTTLIDDSAGTLLASAIHSYSISTAGVSFGTVTGPGFSYTQTGPAFEGGVSLEGSAVNGDIYNVLSVFTGEPFAIQTGAGTTSTVNVGNAGTVGNIGAPLAIFGASSTSAVTVNVGDGSDTSHSTATLDESSGNSNAPFELTGLSSGAIEYGQGVTALNITGGTSAGGTAGVTFNINDTKDGTTTTITGSNGQNFFNLSNAGEANGLDNLVGPVVVHGGGSFNDVVTLEDSDRGSFDDNYVVTSTTVTRSFFGGLTYDDLIGTLTLNAENTLGIAGNNQIDINSTADFVITNVNGQGGNDTINVNDTGISGGLGSVNVSTGSDASTVNVVKDNEPVGISLNGDDVVNIGSTGGLGTMTGIQAPINIVDTPSFFTLTFHDENDTTGHTWTLDNNDTSPPFVGSASVALSGGIGTTTYRPGDLNDPLTFDGGSGGNTFIVNETTGNVVTTINSGFGDDTVDVFATGDDTLNINGQGGQDTVTIGGLAGVGMQNILGPVNVTNALGFTDLTLDDSQDTNGQIAVLTATTMSGLSPGLITWEASDVSSLTVDGGSGGNTFNVTGTLGNEFFSNDITTLNTGTGDDVTNVSATASNGTLDINGQAGDDSVFLGDAGGNMQNILGPVNITNEFAFTAITFDDSADTVGQTFTLAGGATTSTMTGLSPGAITYNNADISTLNVEAGLGSDNFTIDFSAGNPIASATTSTALTYTGGGGASNILNLVGTLPSGPFATEVHNATGPGAGNIHLVDSGGAASGLTYSGLTPVNDTAGALLYTFNELIGFIADPTFAITDGALFGGFQTAKIASTASPTSFETTSIANKAAVVFNTSVPLEDEAGTINLPVASTGLTSLTVNTTLGENDQLNVVATPAGVAVAGNLGSGTDTANVTGAGIAPGTTTTLDGGTGIDTLNYDAGGLVPTVTAGALPGELLITLPGHGTVDAKNFETVKITNAAPAIPTAGAPVILTGVEGHSVSGTVATFHSTVPGAKAAQFTVTINYGDGTTAGGVITQDAVDPTLFYVTGSHTYAEEGLYTTAVSVRYNGGTTSTVINGVTVKTTTAAAAPVSVPGSANIADAPLTGVATSLTGTAGTALSSVQVATFVDTGGPEATSHYTVTINWGDGTATSTGTVTLSGSNFAAKGTHTYASTGTFHTTVTIKDIGGSSITLTSTAHITGSIVITPTGKTVSGSSILEGRSFTAAVATFHDNNSASTTANLSASINWGDGTASSGGSILSNGSSNFTVNGTHTYHDEGTYHAVITIHDSDGETVTVNSTIIVLDAPLVNGHGTNFSATHNVTFTNHLLGNFTDEDATNTPGQNDLVATINWGDSSATTHGTFTKTGATVNVGSFWNVYGTHKYATAGTKHVSVTVMDGGGGTPVTFTLTITVA